jgi:hypothetical protein
MLVLRSSTLRRPTWHAAEGLLWVLFRTLDNDHAALFQLGGLYFGWIAAFHTTVLCYQSTDAEFPYYCPVGFY